MAAVAGREIVISGLVFDLGGYPDGDVYGCFGCAATTDGIIKWQRTTVAGSSGWTDITQADNNTSPPLKSDNRWFVEPLPGGFRVIHNCYTDHRYGC